MEIRWLGHSAFELISDEGVKILVDPFISNNPACPLPVEELEANIICITHGHSDHFGDAMEIANNTNATLVANHEISLFLGEQGFDCVSMNTGGSVFVLLETLEVSYSLLKMVQKYSMQETLDCSLIWKMSLEKSISRILQWFQLEINLPWVHLKGHLQLCG